MGLKYFLWRITGNIVGQDLEDTVEKVGRDFIFIVRVDGDHRIVGAAVGDVLTAH